MSGKTTGKVWDLELPLPQMLVLLAMADKADHNDDNVHPGVPLIAWMTGYSERQVRRVIKQLERDGLLVATRVVSGKPTVYRIEVSKGIQKPAFASRALKPATPDIAMSPHKAQTPDIAVTPDIAMSPLTSHGKNNLQTPDIASAKTVSNVVKRNGSSSSNAGNYSGLDVQAYSVRFDYYRAFELGFPFNAPTKVADTERNKNHARDIFLAGYSTDEVTQLVREKIEQGKADYRFHYLMADLSQARLERNPVHVQKKTPPEVINAGAKLVPAETNWKREPAEAGGAS